MRQEGSSRMGFITVKLSYTNSSFQMKYKLTMPKPGCAPIGGTMAPPGAAAPGAPGAPGVAPA